MIEDKKTSINIINSLDFAYPKMKTAKC